ncbi:MAG TPA: c-type cytochrome, partial [Thermoguttaceae bacterium]|nr:c-type cytochrome [Thermoguttaceae bacterium]
ARCYTCHGPNGEGDGEQAGLSADGEPSVLYDDWNKAKKGATPEETRKRAARFRLPIQPLRPRDFTTATFRGGGEPIDIYWRIHVGIQGTPMPASGTAGTTPGVLAPEQIWDVVNYVRSRARW